VKLYGASLPGPARYSPPKILEAAPAVIHGTPGPALISTRRAGVARVPIGFGV